ncbi:MAG TPA: hypothetical protein VFW95_00705 [Candidatus Limnocylindria bacterium]|nr:hypothetical protein [Candidatus Limnocylindria bacterium]
MQSVASRVLVGLGVLIAALVAIGYAFIFSGIASPSQSDLGTVAIPAGADPEPVYLADGRPAFVIRASDGVRVVDARPPLTPGVPGRLVVWCNGLFVDLVGTEEYGADGALLAGDALTSLIVYPTTIAPGGQSATVGRDGQAAASRFGESEGHACDAADAIMHAPGDGEVYDPSVAAEEEPPGWIWLEGRLLPAGGQALLCDADSDCETGAAVRGIDPAEIPEAGAGFDGRFLGRVRDGAIEDLHYVPLAEAGR